MKTNKEAKKYKMTIELVSINEKAKKAQFREIMKITYKQDYGGGISQPTLEYSKKIEQDLLKRLKDDKVVVVMVENGVITEIDPKDC